MQLTKADGWTIDRGRKPSSYLKKVQKRFLPEQDKKEKPSTKTYAKITASNTEKQCILPFEEHDYNVFSNQLHFYEEESAFEKIKKEIPFDIQKKFSEDLSWFQHEYQIGNESKYYANASRENKIVLDAFERYIGKKSYAGRLNLSKIISLLRKLYY